jgi:hypothetical protein
MYFIIEKKRSLVNNINKNSYQQYASTLNKETTIALVSMDRK